MDRYVKAILIHKVTYFGIINLECIIINVLIIYVKTDWL